jgi:5-methylcytosine-specific restriction endonuclease McrA
VAATPEQKQAYVERNREKVRATKRAWKKANPDAARAHVRATQGRRRDRGVAHWRVANRERDRDQDRVRRQRADVKRQRADLEQVRRARKMGRFVEDVDRDVLFQRDQGVCGICGKPIHTADFQVDHIVPLARGGEHSYANTQVAHPKCNLIKAAT